MKSSWTMKIGREFGFIAMGMRIKKPMDIKVEAIGRQSPHHALFINKRTNRQMLAMEYNPPATAAAALLGSYLNTAETNVSPPTLVVLLLLAAFTAPMRKATMIRVFGDRILLMTGGWGVKRWYQDAATLKGYIYPKCDLDPPKEAKVAAGLTAATCERYYVQAIRDSTVIVKRRSKGTQEYSMIEADVIRLPSEGKLRTAGKTLRWITLDTYTRLIHDWRIGNRSCAAPKKSTALKFNSN